ncbi:MAG TPA: winged helix-turn-helix domain-containing protein [Myxococcaceae bacterium]|nr:winged helix-turn-helix domain-containing protein [Myxococcaceae bacterium]
MATWTFLTNHAHVLVCVWEDSEARVRDIAMRVGITERAVQRILQELESEQYLVRERVGRRNRYRVRGDRPFRHPVEDHRPVSTLLQLVAHRKATRSPARTAARRSAPPRTRARAGR